MNRALVIIVLSLVLSCSEEEAADPSLAKENRAIMLAATHCGSSGQMPWLRNVIRRAEREFDYKGEVYAIEYSNGVAILYQRWISSCLGCLSYDCDGVELILSESAMNEVISGITADNVIYSSF